MRVAWFSAGVSSAVATKISSPDEIIFIDINDHHPDTYRFIADCEKWFGKSITIIRNPKFFSVEDVCRQHKYVNGPKGAKCSAVLKGCVRMAWEDDNPGQHEYVWGYDAHEYGRIIRISDMIPKHTHLFPISEFPKAEVHGYFEMSGIKRPQMYELGYHNNNCIGCVKGGMGYWNKIRIDFPDVFASRAKMERDIGHSIINGMFLDELNPNRGCKLDMIIPDCGLFCGAFS